MSWNAGRVSENVRKLKGLGGKGNCEWQTRGAGAGALLLRGGGGSGYMARCVLGSARVLLGCWVLDAGCLVLGAGATDSLGH